MDPANPAGAVVDVEVGCKLRVVGILPIVRQESGVAIGRDADDRPMFTLGPLGPVGRDEQGKVREFGRLDRRFSASARPTDRCWAAQRGRAR